MEILKLQRYNSKGTQHAISHPANKGSQENSEATGTTEAWKSLSYRGTIAKEHSMQSALQKANELRKQSALQKANEP